MTEIITVIIVDDDIMSIKRLSDDLGEYPDIKVIATCSIPTKACEIIIELQPDILFLDVEMPGMTGIELLTRIKPELHPEIKVIFYTAYNKYVMEALRASAFDYLLKPYLPDELTAIIERYRSYIPQNNQTLEQSLQKAAVSIFAIQTITGLILMSIEKVILFQYTKEQRCWQIMHADNEKLHKLRTNITASELLAISNNFVFISQDCIINLNYLATIENKSLKCTFIPPYEYISRFASQRYFKKLREKLNII